MCTTRSAFTRTIQAFAILCLSWHTHALAAEIDTHVHKSGVFSVKATSRNVEESAADVQFTYTMLGSITGWDGVSFVMPEWSQDTSAAVMNRVVSGMAESAYASIKRNKNRPTPNVLEEAAGKVLERDAYYAKVLYPRLPGSGLTVFNDKGKQEDADFVAYLHLISIDDLGLVQRNLPVRYLLVTSFRATSLAEVNENSHLAFLDSLKLLSAPAVVHDRYTGQYGFDLLLPETRVAYGPLLSSEGVNTETLYVFPEGTPLMSVGDEQLFESLDIVRVEAMQRKNRDFTITLDGTRTLFVESLQASGETFNVTEFDLPRPAFKITISAPLHMTQVCIEAEELLFVVTAGRDDETLRAIIDNLRETGAR